MIDDFIETNESILEEFSRESKEEDPHSLTAFSKYKGNSGKLSREEFIRVMEYKPTEEEILKNKWRGYPDSDLILYLKLYHVIGSTLRLMDDPFISCEVMALNGKLPGILAARSHSRQDLL